MFTKNEELNERVKEEMDIDEESLKKAIKIILKIEPKIQKILNIEPKILCIDSMQQVNAGAIDREREDRIKEIGGIKNNYIDRFNKVDDLFSTIFNKIDKIIDQGIESKKEQVKRMWAIIIVFLGCSAFLFISMIWEKAIVPLFK